MKFWKCFDFVTSHSHVYFFSFIVTCTAAVWQLQINKRDSIQFKILCFGDRELGWGSSETYSSTSVEIESSIQLRIVNL